MDQIQTISAIRGRKMLDWADHIVSVAYRRYGLEVFVFLIVLFFSFFWSFAYKFPMGYSGLYSLMAEKIAQNGFIPPQSIEFYGPGKIPFAYPPLAFYINAFAVTFLGVEQLTFLRFFAPSISILTFFACYLLFRQITSSRLAASIAILLFLTTPDYLNLHVKSDGMVRGLALLFSILGIYFYYTYLSHKRFSFKSILLAGLFLGLSFLSHLSYGVFCVFSIFVLAFWKVQNLKELKQRARDFVLIMVIALLVSAPWWLLVLRRFGLAPFISALNSHATVPGVISASIVPSLIAAKVTLMDKFLLYPLFYMVALPYWLLKRDWHKAIWGLSTGIFLGESARFMALFSAIAIAELCVDLLRHASHPQENTDKRIFVSAAAVFLALFFVLIGRFDNLKSDKPFLTDEVLKVAAWMNDNTDPNAKYLFISDNMNGTNEWMPYLARRTPVLGHWGAEWVGDYYWKHELMSKAAWCAKKDSWECVQRVVGKYASRPGYIIFFRSEFEHMESEINALAYWQIAFQDDQMIIYKDLR